MTKNRQMSKIKKTKIAMIFITAVLVLTAVFAATPHIGANACKYGGMSMIVIEASSNRVLYQSNAKVARPIASTTKILTAITVIENTDLDRVVVIPQKAQGVEGSSIYLQAGEKATVRDLLYGLMLQSGNDCAVALAIAVSGDIAGFSALMNDTARKAGATGHNFVNPHGLHDDTHLCSAYDLALITSYALSNEEFAKIAKAKEYRGMPWQGRDYNRVIVNKNRLLGSYEGATGVKTGFTKRAGRCLVSSAKRDGMEIIAVVLNCGPMFEECSRLMTKAFDEYSHGILSHAKQSIGEARLKGCDTPITLYAAQTFVYPLTKAERDRVETKILLSDELSKGVNELKIATICYYLDSTLLGKVVAYAYDIITVEQIQKIVLL